MKATINITEDRLQADCYLWYHNTFPHLRGTLCYNLNNSRNILEGNKNRSMGIQKGRSDLVLYLNKTAIHIEMKLPGENQNADQKKWQKAIEIFGYQYFICRSLEEFKEIICNFAK